MLVKPILKSGLYISQDGIGTIYSYMNSSENFKILHNTELIKKYFFFLDATLTIGELLLHLKKQHIIYQKNKLLFITPIL